MGWVAYLAGAFAHGAGCIGPGYASGTDGHAGKKVSRWPNRNVLLTARNPARA